MCPDPQESLIINWDKYFSSSKSRQSLSTAYTVPGTGTLHKRRRRYLFGPQKDVVKLGVRTFKLLIKKLLECCRDRRVVTKEIQ